MPDYYHYNQNSGQPPMYNPPQYQPQAGMDPPPGYVQKSRVAAGILAILLGTYAPWLTPAVGWLAAGLTAAVGGYRRRGRLDWRHAGAPLMAGGAAVELMLLLAWGLTAAAAPGPWEQGFLLYGGSLIWGLVLALAGLGIWLAGRRKRP